MIPIKHFEADGRQCQRDGCNEVLCAQHPLAVMEKALPGLFGVPTERCPQILAEIADDQIDVVLRYWMQKTFLEKKALPMPSQLRQILERKGMEDPMPFSAVEAVLNAHEWPSVTMDERREKSIADFRREIVEHAECCGQIARWRDHEERKGDGND